MKQLLFVIVLALNAAQLMSQAQVETPAADRIFRMPLIGENAPAFTAESTNGTITFPSDYGRKWKILFSHPQDFTPVCSSELLELAYLQDEFNKLDVKMAVISTDALETHLQWKKSLEMINLGDRGPVKIKFPIIDDEDINISKKYGMIHPASNSTRSVRGVFIIDPDDIIQAIYFYPMNVGRNTDELIRTIEALQTVRSLQVLTPANWREGNDVFVHYPPVQNVKTENIPEGFYSPSWYMWYKKVDLTVKKP
jgi:peroxiredoxin (alkyl hydroperoxide reductase subunit C)